MMRQAKELCVSTDFLDDLLNAGQVYDEKHIDDMMAYCASMGATRHEWIMDTIWSMYDSYAGGFDLLKVACEAAHRHGMRFDVVYKPFEGALLHPMYMLPLDFPRPQGVSLLQEPWAMTCATRPFLAKNPRLRMARVPGDEDPGGRIAAVRLIKDNDGPLSFSAGDLTLWSSEVNGRFERYSGPMSFHETTQWRRRFPGTDQPCRIVTLGDLNLPASHRFLRISCRPQASPSFTAEVENLVELVNDVGMVIPSTHSQGKVNSEALYHRTCQLQELGICKYLQQDDVRAILADRQRFQDLCQDFYRFEAGGDTLHTLDKAGEIVVMRGKATTVGGALCPAYPQVREHWLEEIKYCLERNVDGVNFRMTSHSRPAEPWHYGFNEPVTRQMTGPGNRAEAAMLNGQAMTLFIKQAAQMLHHAGKELGIHVNALQFQWDDRHGQAHGPVLQNINLEWEQWIANQWVDYVEFRGADMLRPHNLKRVIDHIGLVTRQAGLPFIYQSSRGNKIIHLQGPYPHLEHEMGTLYQHPDIQFYNLYEIASFSRLDAQHGFEGSEELASMVKNTWPVQLPQS